MTFAHLLLLVGWFAGFSSQAKVPATLPQEYRAESKAYVRHEKNSTIYVTENQFFEIASLLNKDGNDYTRLLLQATYHNERTFDDEDTQGNVTVKAWTLLPNGGRKPRWEIHQKGNEGRAGERFFEVTQWGCCAWPNVTTYYSLVSGKRIYAGSFPLIELYRQNGTAADQRYLEFGYSDTHREQPVLEYGDGEHVKQTITLIPPRLDWDPVHQVEVSAADRKSEKSLNVGADHFTFMITLRIYDNAEIRIPVENDAMHPEKAVLPAGYSLKAVE